LSCDATLEGDFRDELDYELPCFTCGGILEIIFHMFPNGDYWIIPEYANSIDD
jgi:hypothetical protein